MRILVVDDPRDGLILANRLSEKGHFAVIAKNLRDAETRLSTESFSLAVLLYSPPYFDGIEILHKMRVGKLKVTNPPRVCVVSRDDVYYEGEMEVITLVKFCARLGADFIQKPFEPFNKVVERLSGMAREGALRRI